MTVTSHHPHAGSVEVGVSKGFVRLKIIVVLHVLEKGIKKVIAKSENAFNNRKNILKDLFCEQPK